MPVELWGATETPQLLTPQRPLLGLVLLLFYAIALSWLLYQRRATFRRLRRNQLLLLAGLLVAAFTARQLFPYSLTLPAELPPPGVAQNPRVVFSLFAALPLVAAAALYAPPVAMLVGLASGLSRALWHSYQIFDPLYFALATGLIAWFLQQRYRGKLYQFLRYPIVAALLGLLLPFPLVGLAAFSYATPAAENLVSFDWAISTTVAQLLPLTLEALAGAVLFLIIFIGLSRWPLSNEPLVPAITERSLRNRLLVNFFFFAIPTASLLIFIVFYSAVRVATHLSVNQMAHDASAVSQQIPAFRNQIQNLLRQYGDDPTLMAADEAVVERQLAQLARTAGAYYRRIILIDATETVRAYYPTRDLSQISLTVTEQEAVYDALNRGVPSITPAQQTPEGEAIVSFVVPVRDADGEPAAALIGRVPGIALNELIVGLQGTVGEGSGFIVDEREQVIAHPQDNSLLTNWTPAVGEQRYFRARLDVPGFAYEGRASGTNARELVYFIEGPDHPWTVVINVPYVVVLRLALQISTPLLLVLVPTILFVGVLLYVLSASITAPLQRLVQASQQLAAGQWDVYIPVADEGELGQLGQAFERMRRSMQQQFNDVRLMLQVSQDVSTSIDINQGVPTILRGMLRGTGAAGARAVLLNPNSRHPMTFADGPIGRAMASLDRPIAMLTREQEELLLAGPEQIRRHLELPDHLTLPVHAVVAVALYSQNRFQGVLWLGYRQARAVSDAELRLLRTLAGQASVLLENARLFATAEGQRRRLAAVLASTSDAVIVTDQTNHVLLINPAMERLFHLQTSEVVNRPVNKVIVNRRLAEALTEREDRVRNLEIPVGNDRTLYASVSTIMRNDGQVMGRVAVLHDITHLKELDHLKSEFVSTVSHDLRGPLTFMRGYITMLPMVGEINEKQQNYVDKILAGVQQMSGLVEDLLDLGRIEAGVELMQNVIDPKQLLASVVDEQADQATARGIQLQVQAPSHLPVLMGDASLVRRAVINLVGNAIKYAPDSRVVVLRAQQDGEEMIFSVHDRGPGIPKKEQIRLFEKFYRVQQKGHNGTKGSGLGLAIVKSIAERHGGRVWVHSQEGKGSAFYFSIPINGAASTEAEPWAAR